ncbi:ribosomal RNA processing protein 1 homolog [Condylostylus longicornis]|uniref:ribosomal RNA processing protein 1 homolog n=1 Tax=Condylostylus longicornis TaxID=2530218 RepID=UPI00244E23BD|nr:ribosomal RNA processing protein 1 homolog [Condylostylus longicornis]
MVALTQQNHELNENGEVKRKIPKEVYIVSQEIKIAKNLSSCDLKLREKQLKRLRKWLQIRSESSFEYTENDFLRIWKGLFYCFWMSDKPLVQEDLADQFGTLIGCFKDLKTSLKFFNAFMKTMCTHWFGLDQWRLDKFMMLTRRMLRHTLMAIKKHNWPEEHIQDFNFYLAESVLDNDVTGMIMHLVEIFMDELAKVSNGKISATAVGEFTKPFIIFLAKQRDSKILGEVRNKIFYHLLWQSEAGRAFQDKFEAWKAMGFPNININQLEKVETAESDAENEEQIENEQQTMDPRAGNVDVFIPILPVDTKFISRIFEKILENEIANAKSKKFIMTLLEKYRKFENGEFPLGVHKMPSVKIEPLKPLLERTTQELDNLDEELHSVDRNLKKLNKKKRRKILNSLNLEEVDENNYEKVLQKAMSKYKIGKGKDDELHKQPKRRKITMTWTEEEIEPKESKKKVELITNTTPSDDSPKKVNSVKIEKKKTKGNTEEQNVVQPFKSEWDKPLEDGEIEYFIPSNKIRLNEANSKLEESDGNTEQNSSLVLNPFSKLNSSKTSKNIILGKKNKKQKLLNVSLPEKKRVKIALAKNMIQKPSEYIKQIRNSPQLPYDADKKPMKSLLKPNQMPSPINPFYKKKIGLQLNETF